MSTLSTPRLLTLLDFFSIENHISTLMGSKPCASARPRLDFALSPSPQLVATQPTTPRVPPEIRRLTPDAPTRDAATSRDSTQRPGIAWKETDAAPAKRRRRVTVLHFRRTPSAIACMPTAVSR